MRLLRKILFPLSFLYAGITYIRNKMYDWGVLKSQTYDFPVIGVGNLSVGGTGKSPMIEYLVFFLHKHWQVATLSRGYKRETKGFVLLTGKETARQVGDEPLQFKSKYPELTVAVDEQRVHGIEELMQLQPAPEVVLLDDSFQHRKVSPGLNILLTPYNDLYSDDHLLPSGNLREPKSGAQRAHLVVVTKCPLDLAPESQARIRTELALEKHQQLFFSGIDYGVEIYNEQTSLSLNTLSEKEFTLVTGIANPKPLVAYLKSMGLNFRHLAYPDHHNFNEKELDTIRELTLAITTEKDFMRLKSSTSSSSLFYLPMQMKFLSTDQAREFEEEVKNFVKKK